MTDDREKVALDIAAEFVLSALTVLSTHCRAYLALDGATFSDEQWKQIGDRVMAATPMPDKEQWAAAYEFLAQHR